MREWAQQRVGLSRKLAEMQNRWRLFAGQYVALPLSFRRDMSRGMCFERYTCAAILQHIAAFPNIISSRDIYASTLTVTFDMLLSETETCLVSRGWYAMLHEAASPIRRWENVSGSDLDPQRVVTLLNQAETAAKTIGFMLQSLTSSNLTCEEPPGPSPRMTRAWNMMCYEVRWGKSLEEAATSATWVTTFAEAPYTRNGGRRVRIDSELAVPRGVPSEPPNPEQRFGGDNLFASRCRPGRPSHGILPEPRHTPSTAQSTTTDHATHWSQHLAAVGGALRQFTTKIESLPVPIGRLHPTISQESQ